jgi:hypothetical protein
MLLGLESKVPTLVLSLLALLVNKYKYCRRSAVLLGLESKVPTLVLSRFTSTKVQILTRKARCF